MKYSKILITGACGFIGSALAEYLKKKDVDLVLFDVVNGQDIMKLEDLMEIGHVDTVVHLAANINVQNAFGNAYQIYNDNILGTLNVLEYCKANKVRRNVFVSSYVYGNPVSLPIDEFHPIVAINPYAMSKIICEQLINSYGKDFEMNSFILRCFNIYGKGQNERFIIPLIFEQLFGDSKAIELRDLRPKRDFLYIKDFVKAIETCCFIDNVSGVEAINIGSGVSFSVREILDMIFELSGKTKPTIEDGIERKNEILDCVADISKAKRLLGWSPDYDIRTGLLEMISMYEGKL